MNRALAIRLVLALGIGGAIVLAGLNRDAFHVEALDAWLAGLGIWAPVAFVLLYGLGTVLFFPGSLLTLAGGVMFGPVLGTILNLSGATLGAGLSFVIARYLAGDWVAQRSGSGLKRLMKGVEADGWRFVALIRLVPLFPFNLSNYALGLTPIGLRVYLAVSALAMAPGALAYTWLGHAGREALEGNGSAIRYGLLALGLLAVIAFVPSILKRLRGG